MAARKRGSRASMREGPLADLFRKTDEDAQAPPESTPALTPPEQEPVVRATPMPREAAPPHEEEWQAERPRVPSPQERLRAAFSSELPENMLERTPSARSLPAEDVYARAGHSDIHFVARNEAQILGPGVRAG